MDVGHNTDAPLGRRTATDHVRIRPYVSALLRLLELNSPQLRDDSDTPMPELSVSTRALLAQRRVADLEAQARAQQARISEIKAEIALRESQSYDAVRQQIDRIQAIQDRITEMEQASEVSDAQGRILAIKIRQVELQLLMNRARQTVQLRGKEADLLATKRRLEDRIKDLENKIREKALLLDSAGESEQVTPTLTTTSTATSTTTTTTTAAAAAAAASRSRSSSSSSSDRWVEGDRREAPDDHDGEGE